MSTNGSHLKRPVPLRTEPIRNRLAPSPRPVPPPEETFGPTMMGALENGVRTAYAVIDDYMRRGQETARGIYNDTNRGSQMNDYRGNYGSRYNNPWGAMPGMEQWMTMMKAWTDAWSAFIPGAWGQMWNMPGYAGTGYGAAAPKISVQVASYRPAEVTAHLHPGAECVALTVDPLRGDGVTAHAIEHVTITRDIGRVRISLKVPAEQPAGCYRGQIRKSADGTHAGELTVVISES